MKLSEIQAKKVLANFQIPVPKNGGSVSHVKELPAAIKRAGPGPWLIKAQVLTGGRGKAGGIQLAKNYKQAKEIVERMLGMKLVTHQTGPDGIIVKSVLVEKPAKIQKELYFSVTMNRKLACPVVIASAEGGMEIETLAQSAPDKITIMRIHPLTGLKPFQARELLFKLNIFDADSKKNARRTKLLQDCVTAFLKSDASLIEINPLALTSSGELLCLDAKIVIDDSALYRHPELKEFENPASLSPAERQAQKAGISYVPLTGQIGCMVNGAGLAMATMDIIKQHGGEPANFLDVGGGANVEQVTTAFKIILSDKNVRAIFVNIFGGIMKCDTIAQGIIAAVKQIKLAVPLVVRLQGNRVEEGRSLLRQSGLNIVSIDDLADAAKKAVELSRV